MHPPLLRISNLGVSFISETGTTIALQEVGFDIARGETLAIVGESGSGKSVTALSILRLLPESICRYNSGSIFYCGEGNEPINLLEANRETLQQIRGNKIGMIFQEPMTSLNPVLTCGYQVMETICQHKKITRANALQQTLQLFREVDLPEPEKLVHKYPHQLSGGQKQRVMIAMAICCNPGLLICDEPTTALDVTVQKNIMGLIRKLQQERQMGVLFISHDLSLVGEMANRIMVMYRGQVVETGAVEQILKYPKQAYTRALIACRPALYPKGTRLPVVADFMNEEGIPQTRVVPLPVAASKKTNETVLVRGIGLTVSFAGKKDIWGKSNSKTIVLNQVDIEIYRGETLGLVGESGCGKTTLGRALLLLQQTDSGTVLYNGNPVNHNSRSALKEFRRKAQLVFQDPYSSLNGRITIGEAITEPMMVHGIGANAAERKEMALTLLDKVQLLPAHFNRYPHEFSGGQRQRVVIARVLALNPEFLICDESVSALDVSVQAQVLNLLNDLKADFGFTVLFISHDLSVIRYISDRIMVMRNGNIVESGSAEQVCNNPVQDYTRKLLEAVPQVKF
jgi:peptide/nickel transport system ATP-binding protein